jgi:peptidyl-prolyl cis-trans isomerase SurA
MSVAENARRLMEQLGQGGSFQALARQFSEATTAAQGGDIGWVRLQQLPETLQAAIQRMEPGQLAGPIEAPGGVSILLLIDKRRILTADPRDATLSLKQIILSFPAGTTQARASELAGRFAVETQRINGCGQADGVAASLGATVVTRDQIAMRDLPAPLQATMGAMQIGQVTPPFGNPSEGVSVLVLCGRDLPEDAALPSTEDVAERIREDRVNRRAQRYMRDLRRDAIIEYS